MEYRGYIFSTSRLRNTKGVLYTRCTILFQGKKKISFATKTDSKAEKRAKKIIDGLHDKQ